MNGIIEFKNITKKYGGVTALNNVTFQMKSGEITGLIGANGAGKTTSLRLLTNYIDPDTGEVFVNNEKITRKISFDKIIAFIPDEPVYYELLTVEEHFRLINSLYPKGVYSPEELIYRLDLEEHMRKLPHMLSKGNKQKLMICTALLREFDFLLADEPFTGLDPNQIKVFKDILLELKSKGKGIILSSHLLDAMETICDCYVILDKGNVIGKGTKQELVGVLKKDKSLEQIYISLSNMSRGEPR